MEPANDACGARQTKELGIVSAFPDVHERAWRDFRNGIITALKDLGCSPQEISFILGRFNRLEPYVNIGIPSSGMAPEAHAYVLRQFQETSQFYVLELIVAYRELWAAGAG